MYGVVLNIQKELITQHCVGDCRKILLGCIDFDGLSLLPCKEKDCPHLDKQLEESIGEVFGEDVYLRILK